METKEILTKLLNLQGAELDQFIEKRIAFLLKTNNPFYPGYNLGINVKPIAEPYAFRHFFNPEHTTITAQAGLGDIFEYFFDDNKTVLGVFSNILSKEHLPKTFEQVCELVAQTVYAYFGGVEVRGTEKDRFSHIKSLDFLADDERNYISAFRGTQNGWCMERAAVAHQLFHMLGIESEFVCSPILIDGKRETHAFNMLRKGDNCYLFDCTLMDFTSENTVASPIVAVLPKSAYDDISNIPKRTFHGKDMKQRHCVYNPENLKTITQGEQNDLVEELSDECD